MLGSSPAKLPAKGPWQIFSGFAGHVVSVNTLLLQFKDKPPENTGVKSIYKLSNTELWFATVSHGYLQISSITSGT